MKEKFTKSICFFTNSMFKIGGEQRITSIIANGLLNAGYNITIIVKNKEKIDYELYNLSPKVNLIFLNYSYSFRLNNTRFFEIIRKINRKYGIFKNNKNIIRHFFCSNKVIKDLIKIFERNKFDLVIGVAGDRSYILSYLKKHINAKLIFWNHSDVDSHYKKIGSRYYMEESFIKPLIKQFDEIVVLTKYDKEKLDSYYNVNCNVISNCKSFVSKEKSSLNHQKFLAVGRLVNQKGFDYLIESMKIFAEQNDEWKLNIYGDGKLKNKLNQIIVKYNLEDRIKINASSPNIKEIFLEHDIFLMSSKNEGFGLVTLEALTCGLPVIAFDIPANKDIIQNQVNGILIESFDVKKFGEAMVELASSVQKRINIQNNITKTTDKFSEEKFLEKWESLF